MIILKFARWVQRKDIEGREVNAMLFKCWVHKCICSQSVYYQSMARKIQTMGVNVYKMLLKLDNILSVKTNNKLMVCILIVLGDYCFIFNNLFLFYFIKVSSHSGLWTTQSSFSSSTTATSFITDHLISTSSLWFASMLLHLWIVGSKLIVE